MSETEVRIQSRPEGWFALPQLSNEQQNVVDGAREENLVVRGAPSSGRTTTALAVFHDAYTRGLDPLLLVPDRTRADALMARAQALAPTTVRPVRTPAAFAFHIVSEWRTHRRDPRGPVELMTGARQDQVLAELIATVPAPWPEEQIPLQMRQMQGFRTELRSLFARAGEADIDGPQLIAAGKTYGMPQWEAAGTLLTEYLDGAEHSIEYPDILRVDLSRIQSLAAQVISSRHGDAGDHHVDGHLTIPRVVVVDDLHDCTPTTITLLRALDAQGCRIVAFSDSDVAVASYRGGEPHLDLRLQSALNCRMGELGDVFRQPREIRGLIQRLASSITQSGPSTRREASVVDSDLPGSVDVHVTATNAQLGALIARKLRSHHLHEGVAWHDQAVIVRSAAMAEEFSRYLVRAGIPVDTASRAFAFARQPVTRVLLDLLAAPVSAVDSSQADQLNELASDLVTSPLIGVDPLTMYRTLRACHASASSAASIRPQEPAQTHTESADAENASSPSRISLVDVVENPELIHPHADPPTIKALETAAKLWSLRGRSGIRPRRALWDLWDAAQVAAQWQDRAMSGGEDAPWCDDQLDAVVALMRVADIWEQRHLTADAVTFAREQLADDIPVDTVTRIGIRPPGVEVLTPAQAMGRHWQVVAILGLQDGAWPNLRLRDRILRADLISDLNSGRVGVSAQGQPVLVDDPHAARRAVLDDERRLLVAAVSRSTRVLHVGSVRATEQAPSTFFDTIARYTNVQRVDASVPLEEVPPPLDLPGQIAALRRVAAADGESPEKETAIRLLALLAREGIAAAQPRRWMGSSGTLSSDQPIGARIVLSPSQLESALECPLKWFLTSVNASPSAGDAQTLGSVIHAIAEKHPHGDEEEIRAELDAHLEELGYDETTWAGAVDIQHARGVADALAHYIGGVPASVDVEVEKQIRADVADVMISGRIDRIEHVDGGVRLTDLKTGKPITKKAAQEHAQLAAYQLALEEQGITVVAAQLVFLGNEKPEIRTQKPLDDDTRQQWRDRLASFASEAKKTRFAATPSDAACRFCAFTYLCPAKDQGRRTVE
ncbi:ATP-dependent helicase [Schaalia sp. ZJ405]|uniref:PD-(D/E)XK nuclease family protein n=1 Tax=Schaalia sp. ZJ405 TaxID=2709403 RepID=UPI0013ECA231|nr:PD-(D/E)XK nuclease family protein [Schaalia sp. ZJ405]QPK80847.1 ATP-dependent helicase [Schaalia sp. ZJ405]